MKKIIFCLSLILFSSSLAYARGVYMDNETGRKYAYLGSYSAQTGQGKWLDLDNNTIIWFDAGQLEGEIDRFTIDEFYKKTLGNGFVFLTSSETPYWEARISNSSIIIDNAQGKKEEAPIEFNYVEDPIDSIYFIMFHSKDRRIYGSLIERIEDSGCLFSLNNEISVYEILVNFDGNTLKGCATLEKK